MTSLQKSHTRINLTGLLAMLVVAAWQYGHRRNQSEK